MKATPGLGVGYAVVRCIRSRISLNKRESHELAKEVLRRSCINIYARRGIRYSEVRAHTCSRASIRRRFEKSRRDATRPTDRPMEHRNGARDFRRILSLRAREYSASAGAAGAWRPARGMKSHGHARVMHYRCHVIFGQLNKSAPIKSQVQSVPYMP